MNGKRPGASAETGENRTLDIPSLTHPTIQLSDHPVFQASEREDKLSDGANSKRLTRTYFVLEYVWGWEFSWNFPSGFRIAESSPSNIVHAEVL